MTDKDASRGRPCLNRVYDAYSDGGHDEEEEESCCQTYTNKINSGLEKFFVRTGYVVGNNPWKTIIISIICCALCFVGILEYQVENRGDKNWVSQTSDAIKHKEWVDREFPVQFRSAYVLLEKKDSSNILTADSIRDLRKIDMIVKEIYIGTSNRQWKDICFSTSNNFCVPPKSILELWRYNDTLINVLTDHDVTEMLNKQNFVSPLTGQRINMNGLVGEPRRYSQNGTIQSGSILKITFMLKKRTIFDKSIGNMIDSDGEAWEEEFDNILKKTTLSGYNIYFWTLWANNKASNDASSGDTQFFIVGYILVILFLVLVLGSFSRLNHKVYLALGGILTIGLSIGVAYGLGSAFQLRATPVHNVLPFLLLGIGVDDIFVIVQCWDNIQGSKLNSQDQDSRTVADKISLTLKHAGVSVLVTSLTDICAFMIGATTILPALQSFCIWCGLGILSVFVMTLTFFTALLAIDAKRQQSNRDACCCCVKLPEDWTPMGCSKKNRLQDFMQNFFAPAVLSVPGKVISVIVVSGLLACGIYGVVVELKQDFKFKWFLPPDSPPRMYTDKDEMGFPSDGRFGSVYIGKIDYYKEHQVMDQIVNQLNNNKFVGSQTVKSWYHSYYHWLWDTHNNSLLCDGAPSFCRTVNESLFYSLLQVFLSDPKGKIFSSNIKFDNANKTVIKASKIGYTHTKFDSAADEIKGMESVQDVINPKLMTVDPHPLLPFAHSRFYVPWQSNKVISEELARNLALAMLCVFLVTLFVLSNFSASFMVVICVLLSLVDITGFMAFWGLTIDTVTTIILVIAIGLTVDYSAHIAHAFMVAKEGGKNERMRHGLSTVGPAVVNGGFSTFLAFVLLAASTSYVFLTFFKVFFLVVLFGMLHGLVFLPVMLSVIGPSAHDRKNSNSTTIQHDVNKNNTIPLNDHSEGEKVITEKEDDVYAIPDGTANVSYVPE